jgi:hypothetical protein
MKSFAITYLAATKNSIYREDITVTELLTIPNLPHNVIEDIKTTNAHINNLQKIRDLDKTKAFDRLALIAQQLGKDT